MFSKLYMSFLFFLRDFLSRKMFQVIQKYCKGNVLDVGGWDFYLKAKKFSINIESWTSLEKFVEHGLDIKDPKYSLVIGDGCNMPFQANSFETILNIQVLEHVFDPNKMVSECARVLKKDGVGIFLIPQTANIHMTPYHYYNFTRFWIEEVMNINGLEIIDIFPLGGGWMTNAYRNFYFLLMIFKPKNNTYTGLKRNFFYYLLLPFSILFAIISVLISLCFSIGDYYEEPPNHLVVVRK